MDKKLQDYIHFYIGGQMVFNHTGEDIVCRLINVSQGGCFASGISKDGKTFNYYGNPDAGKLILSKLSDISEKEAFDLEIYMWDGNQDAITGDPMMIMKMFEGDAGYMPGFSIVVKAINWCRQHSFDVDRLISSGLAIDQSTLKPQ